MSEHQKTMDQILEEKIHNILMKHLDETTITKKEVYEIVDELKEEMEELTAKIIKKHFKALAEHILNTIGD